MQTERPQPTKMGKSPPRRVPNAARRPREYLTADEVDRLVAAARRLGRHGERDAALILIAFRHGFRVSELVALRWSQVDLRAGLLHVRRVKNGIDTVHPLRGPELRLLRALERRYGGVSGGYVFASERGGPLSAAGVRKIVERAGRAAGLDFPVHPHMLRHATGFYLAAKGEDTRAIQAYLGHRSIQHTVRYTALAPGRFERFWTD